MWEYNYIAANVPSPELYHYGVKGMKKGKRRWTNPDGSLNEAGKIRYAKKVARQTLAKSRLNSVKNNLKLIDVSHRPYTSLDKGIYSGYYTNSDDMNTYRDPNYKYDTDFEKLEREGIVLTSNTEKYKKEREDEKKAARTAKKKKAIAAGKRALDLYGSFSLKGKVASQATKEFTEKPEKSKRRLAKR